MVIITEDQKFDTTIMGLFSNSLQFIIMSQFNESKQLITYSPASIAKICQLTWYVTDFPYWICPNWNTMVYKSQVCDKGIHKFRLPI